jgi:hypothetical protein
MKKKLIVNALSALLSLSLLTASSFALLGSTTSITSNTLTVGTIATKIFDSDTNGNVIAFGKDATKGFTTLSNTYTRQKANNELNLASGDTISRIICLQNTGSLDQFFKIYFANLSVDANHTLAQIEPYCHITITGTNSHGSSKVVKTNITLSQLTDTTAIAGFLNATGDAGRWVNLGISTYNIAITLDKSAPNTLQGASINFDIKVDSVQAANNMAFINDGAATQNIDLNPALITW